jgi:uncharacterized protein
MTNYPSSSSKLTIAFQIITALLVMIGLKELVDYFEIIGAGSFGIWGGIATATMLMKKDKISWGNFGNRLPRGGRNWLIHIGIALLTVLSVFLIMGLVLDPILSSLGLEKPDSAADRFAFFLGKPTIFLLYLVTIVWVGAALGEELLMRGFLLNRLNDLIGRNRLGSILALILHGAFFGALHSYQGLAGIITTGMVGIIFGSVYLLTKRRLFPLIIAHGIINTISLTAYYLNDGVV